MILAILSPLFVERGQAPTTAKEIEHWGTWDPAADARIVWSFPLNDDWLVWVNTVSQFGLRPRRPYPCEISQILGRAGE